MLLVTSLLPAFVVAQTNIQKRTLKDGVERWHRVKAEDRRPWFFQQVENLFNVALPAKDQLPFGVSVAFLIGVSEYDYVRPQLPFVKNDVQDMREFLLNSGGFDTVYVAIDKMATPTLVEDFMTNRFRKSLGQRDRLLFYYSGHGADLGGRTGYIQFSLAQPDNFASQVLAINRCVEWSSILPVSHILFLYDCCSSGMAFSPRAGSADTYSQFLSTLSGNGSRTIITAGTSDEKTYEVKDRQGRGNGVFTRAFLNALASGAADQRSTGFITNNEIFAQLEIGVKSFAAIYNKKITPRRWELEEDEFRGTFIFVNPAAKNPSLSEDYSRAFNAQPRGEPVAAYGIVRVISYITGKVFIDDAFVGDVESGDAKDFYNMLVGTHKIEVRGLNEADTATINVNKGQPTPVTIAAKTTAPLYSLRHKESHYLTSKEVKSMLVTKGFYDRDENKDGNGIPHNYELKSVGDEQIVLDHATGLMWQQSGASTHINLAAAEEYIRKLKADKFAGFNDWRLPTLEEAMSLMERQKQNRVLYLDSVFEKTQSSIWTSDEESDGVQWVVSFNDGLCGRSYGLNRHVRAVRSAQMFSAQPLYKKIIESKQTPIYSFRREVRDDLSEEEVKKILTNQGFFHSKWNKKGKGIDHLYESRKIANDEVVIDHATGLMWQQGGSNNYIDYAPAEVYVRMLNTNKFAGFNDWRLPTLEETMSLVEPKNKYDYMYINPVFHKTQEWVWTADRTNANNVWVVDFGSGYCGYRHVDYAIVRAVRSVEEHIIRHEPRGDLSEEEVKRMLVEKELYHSNWNNNGQGMPHDYEYKKIGIDKVILDHSTGLMWQQDGPQFGMLFADAEKVVRKMNIDKFAGFTDWRLPTLEEAMSLMEPEKRQKNLYIDSSFKNIARSIWTADKRRTGESWVVLFKSGICITVFAHINITYGVLSVRLVQELADQPRYSFRRDKRNDLSEEEVRQMLVKNGLFDSSWNKNGKGIAHNYQFKEFDKDSVVIDHATGLMWQRGGSPTYWDYADAEAYVQKLNTGKYAGFSNWRLPTLEEAMSLMVPKKKSDDFYIDRSFDKTQGWIWTADKEETKVFWTVVFLSGGCLLDRNVLKGSYVRAVHSVP